MSADIIQFPRPDSDERVRLDVTRDLIFSILDAKTLDAAKSLADKALAAIDGEALA